MSEALYIPEEHLEEVVGLIRFALKNANHVSRSVKINLNTWCNEQESYLQELKEDNQDDDDRPKKRKTKRSI